jgi:hypothetical protein
MDRQDHLTDEQFAEILLGFESPSVQGQLRSCSQCAEEAAQVTGALSDFNQQSKLWAERRAATSSVSVKTQQHGHSWAPRPPAWTIAALGIVLASVAGWSVHRSHESVATFSVARPPAVSNVAPITLKADNDLLSAIDGELRVDDSTSATAYRLSTSSRSDRTRADKKAMSE